MPAPAAAASAGYQRVQWVLNLASLKHRVLMLGEGDGAAPDEDCILVDLRVAGATCPSSHAPMVPLQAASEALELRAADDRTVAHYGEKTVTHTVPKSAHSYPPPLPNMCQSDKKITVAASVGKKSRS